MSKPFFRRDEDIIMTIDKIKHGTCDSEDIHNERIDKILELYKIHIDALVKYFSKYLYLIFLLFSGNTGFNNIINMMIEYKKKCESCKKYKNGCDESLIFFNFMTNYLAYSDEIYNEFNEQFNKFLSEET